MCGLLAFVAAPAGAVPPGAAHATAAAIAQASHLMRHRGPDEPGTWADPAGTVVFGFNRLSIIDIAHSHQPLRWGPPETPDRYELVFNGEIYNYLELRAELAAQHGAVFTTDGDGEAIVAAYHYWGADALARLRGMFAFALWDTATGELFCARDPFGIKPLFMATGTGGTAVASEKKCLLDLADVVGFDTAIDERAVQHYTVLQYVPEPETLHRGVRRLESGCYARIRPGGQPATTRYFVPRFAGGSDRPRHRAGPLRRDHRGPGGLGGQAHARRRHRRVVSVRWHRLDGDCGVGHPAQPAADHVHHGFEREGFSEVDVAVASAEAIGARHIAKVVSPDEFVEALPEIVWYLDEPVADPALVPLFFVAREARKHVKVVLSGEGADELFGGYTIYREPLSLKPFDYLPRPLRRSMGKVSKPLPEGMRGKSLLHRGSLTLEERYYGNARSFLRRAAARRAGGVPAGVDAHRRHGAGLRGIGRLGSGRPDAAHRPVHLVARRHPGQGRQDDHGQLVGASSPVPGPRGVRRRVTAAGGCQDHPHHHQVRAAPRAGADRAAACAQSPEAGLPGSHPALAARRPVAGVGARDDRRVGDRLPDRPRRPFGEC